MLPDKTLQGSGVSSCNWEAAGWTALLFTCVLLRVVYLWWACLSSWGIGWVSWTCTSCLEPEDPPSRWLWGGWRSGGRQLLWRGTSGRGYVWIPCYATVLVYKTATWTNLTSHALQPERATSCSQTAGTHSDWSPRAAACCLMFISLYVDTLPASTWVSAATRIVFYYHLTAHWPTSACSEQAYTCQDELFSLD